MSYKDTMNNMGWSMQVRITVLISVLLFAGCTGIGPPTVDRDRFDYVSAISESWKRQTLLNLIKVRYLDAPVFMDVASVISQYALEGEIVMGFAWNDANSQTLGGSATYTDRPPHQLCPADGGKLCKEPVMADTAQCSTSRIPKMKRVRLSMASLNKLWR
jgi:hypothetical protein